MFSLWGASAVHIVVALQEENFSSLAEVLLPGSSDGVRFTSSDTTTITTLKLLRLSRKDSREEPTKLTARCKRIIGVNSRKNLDNFAWKLRDVITAMFEYSKVDRIGGLRKKFFKFERQEKSGMRIRNEELRLGPCRGPNEVLKRIVWIGRRLDFNGGSRALEAEWLCQIKNKGVELPPIPTFKMMRRKGKSADAED
ncbi:hypothetical protein BY996DRAFT_6580736 [Phakopsora pachyrhizi]|nr:hypothetical protein BY996DRAFT_6580736 [Phakopsora pachyrhizi]